jgi:hypothetical protein
MGTKQETLTKDLPILPSAKIKEIIEETYKRFFHPKPNKKPPTCETPPLLGFTRSVTS